MLETVHGRPSLEGHIFPYQVSPTKCVLLSKCKCVYLAQPFEYQKHLNTKLFEVWISNGSIFKWSVYVLDQTFEYGNDKKQ